MPLSRRKSSREPPMPVLTGGLGIMKLLESGCGISVRDKCVAFCVEPYDRWDLDRGVRQSVSSSIPVV